MENWEYALVYGMGSPAKGTDEGFEEASPRLLDAAKQVCPEAVERYRLDWEIYAAMPSQFGSELRAKNEVANVLIAQADDIGKAVFAAAPDVLAEQQRIADAADAERAKLPEFVAASRERLYES